MTSTITLFHNCPIQMDKNFTLDHEDIEGYLSSLQKNVINDFQYQKHSADLTIKITLDQINVDPISGIEENWNYVSIKNNSDKENTYYYFIVQKNWKSRGACELVLHMDVLMTFPVEKCFSFNPRTYVKRMHVDRYKVLEKKPDGRIHISEVVDGVNEGINPQLYMTESENLNTLPYRGYLLYRKHVASLPLSQPVDVYYLGSRLKYDQPSFSNKSFSSDTFPQNGTSYYFENDSANTGGQFIFTPLGSSQQVTRTLGSKDSEGRTLEKVLIWWTQLTATLLIELQWRKESAPIYIERKGVTVNVVLQNLNNAEVVYTTSVDSTKDLYTQCSHTGVWYGIYSKKLVTLPDITNIDRSDPLNIKLILYPEIPADIDKGGTMTDYGLLLNAPLEEDYEINRVNKTFLKYGPKEGTITLPIQAWTIRNDPKLKASEFQLLRLTYDSFPISIKAEDVDGTFDTFIIKFKRSNTINSRFVYKFGGFKLKYATEDFPLILAVQRNNEATLFNDEYLNYMKVGYNYDQKAKVRKTIEAVVSPALSLVGAGASFKAASASKGYSIAGGIGFLTSAASGIFRAGMNIAQMEDDQRRKIQELQATRLGIEGSDDIDLMVYASDNALWRRIYKARDEVINECRMIFELTGYRREMIGQPIDVRSRVAFNFLQCSPVLDVAEKVFIPKWAQDEISARYEMGVFFIHNNNGDYDFNLANKDNYERSLLK